MRCPSCGHYGKAWYYAEPNEAGEKRSQCPRCQTTFTDAESDEAFTEATRKAQLPKTPVRLTASRVRAARELMGLTRREWARHVKIPLFRYEQIEAGTVKAKPAEIEALCGASRMMSRYFTLPPLDEAMWESTSLNWHTHIRICDVCEAETGDDDSRARERCAACRQDLCEVHDTPYTISVPLPHNPKQQQEVVVTHYCPDCYRRYVSQEKARQTRATKAAQTALPRMSVGKVIG